MLDIRGFIKNSFNEWEGRVAAVIFTAGCNWRCPYCHGVGLVKSPQDFPQISTDEIFDYLGNNRGWVDDIAITGGEPTLQAGLIDFIRDLKEFGVGVKLESNGTNPQVIAELLREELLDCLCFDYKVPLDSESLLALTGVSAEQSGLERVKESYRLSRQADGIEKEFHTTLCPSFISPDIISRMGSELECPDALWVLQQYENDVEMINFEVAGERKFSQQELDELEIVAKSKHSKILLRRGK